MGHNIGGSRLLSCEITEPLVGPWRVEAVCDAVAALTGRVELELDGETWSGTVVRSVVESGTVRTLLVGGAGALATDSDASVELGARAYRSVDLGTVLADIARESGETVSATSATLRAVRVPVWSRSAGPARRALEALVVKAGQAWRLLRDGSLWLGAETWPVSEAKPILAESRPEQGVRLYRDGIGIRPGTTIDGVQVREVCHRLQGSGTVTEAWESPPSETFARTREMARRELDMAQLWPVEVVRQRADGSLEVLPDDARVRGSGIDGVLIVPGLPGLHVEVPAGSRCLVGYAGGDPSRPRVVAWDHETTITLLRIGSASADFVALAGKVLTELQSIKTWADAHTHPTGVGPSGAPLVPMTTPASMAATLLKTQ